MVQDITNAKDYASPLTNEDREYLKKFPRETREIDANEGLVFDLRYFQKSNFRKNGNVCLDNEHVAMFSVDTDARVKGYHFHKPCFLIETQLDCSLQYQVMDTFAEAVQVFKENSEMLKDF